MDNNKDEDIICSSRLFVERSGRLKIYAWLFQIGDDLQIFLYGGKAHLGAVAFAEPGAESGFCHAKDHRDHEPALEMANRVSTALGKRVGVSCGIHYDKLERPELAKILELCALLAGRIICSLSKDQNQESVMLDINELEKFAQFIRSGALEEKFKCGSEETRHKILELLEKLMDTADLADECATRLIFRV